MVSGDDFTEVIHVVDIANQKAAPEKLLDNRNDRREADKAGCYPEIPKGPIRDCREWIKAAPASDMRIWDFLDANPEGDSDDTKESTGNESLTRCGELRCPSFSGKTKCKQHDGNLSDVCEWIQVCWELTFYDIQADEQNHRGNHTTGGF